MNYINSHKIQIFTAGIIVADERKKQKNVISIHSNNLFAENDNENTTT